MLVPVILSGGAGTRLWPVSREGHPKPFMRLPDGSSLLRKTLHRAVLQATGGELLLVTNREYYFSSKDEIAQAAHGSQPIKAAFLLEPFGRNTAPAVGLAAHHVAARFGRDAVMLVLPADHLIEDLQHFSAAVAHAARLAGQGYLVTFGIQPTAPETGFGYIHAGKPCDEQGARQVQRFVEKPDQKRAEEYIASPDFYWNSGMFCMTAGTFLDELAVHQPQLAASVDACWQSIAKMSGDERMQEIDPERFEQCADISIDYAVMEHSSRAAVVPANFDWNDIGSWQAIRTLVSPDSQGNRVLGEAVVVDAHDNYLYSEDRLIAAVGVHDLVIVDTPDALLVSAAGSTQEVKRVVAELRARGHESHRLHRTVSRPWGTYTTLEQGDRYKIKRIEVKPGASLSLQMHYHRSEHWIVVSGTARITNGDQVSIVHTNESTFIPAGHRHRLENPGVLPLVMIEVQSGDYLGEDDIVRFSDNYGRS